MGNEESLSQKVKLKRSQDYERDNDNLRAIINRMEMERTSMTLIDQLRFEEGSSVTIFSDNPDFGADHTNKVEVISEWTGWEVKIFTGESVFECLDKAFNAMLKAKAKEKTDGPKTG